MHKTSKSTFDLFINNDEELLYRSKRLHIIRQMLTVKGMLCFIPFFYVYIYLPVLITAFLSKDIFAWTVSSFFIDLFKNFGYSGTPEMLKASISSGIWDLVLLPISIPYSLISSLNLSSILSTIAAISLITLLLMSPYFIFRGVIAVLKLFLRD